jgi:hypothetical protein
MKIKMLKPMDALTLTLNKELELEVKFQFSSHLELAFGSGFDSTYKSYQSLDSCPIPHLTLLLANSDTIGSKGLGFS